MSRGSILCRAGRAHLEELLADSCGLSSYAAFWVDTVLIAPRQNDTRVAPHSTFIKRRCIEFGDRPDIALLASASQGILSWLLPDFPRSLPRNWEMNPPQKKAPGRCRPGGFMDTLRTGGPVVDVPGWDLIPARHACLLPQTITKSLEVSVPTRPVNVANWIAAAPPRPSAS